MEKIRTHMAATPEGQPVSTRSLLAYGSRAAVDQALSRLVKQEYLIRPVRGVYVRPERSVYVGVVPPDPMEVARVLAEPYGGMVQVQGAEAALMMGFSTQVPMHHVFQTSGPSRKLRLGRLQVTLKHVAPGRLALAGRPAGVALTALCYLGPNAVTSRVLEKTRSRISKEEFEVLRNATQFMPEWLRRAFVTHREVHPHG